jgi:DNA-binding CsgD family transcriptional regulator
LVIGRTLAASAAGSHLTGAGDVVRSAAGAELQRGSAGLRPVLGTSPSSGSHTTQARRVGNRRTPLRCKRLRDGGDKVATTAGARRAQMAVRLTPAERDVVQLVSEGLGNKDIATRLFISPRTVQTHLTHVYTKLGLTSRVQLVQEAARHA